MSMDNHQVPDDTLERATAALRTAPVPNQLPAQLLASTVEALQKLQSRPDTIRLHERRKFMLRIVRYSSASAALLLIGLVGFFWLGDQSATLLFGQVVENINKAKTVSFVVRVELGDRPEMESKMSLRGDMLRHEIPDVMIMIMDTSQRKGLQLDLQRKIATKIDWEGRVPAEDLQDPIERLRKLKANTKDNVEQFADEELNGAKCQVYQVRGTIKAGAVFVGDRFKLWVDAKSGLPVKIHGGDDKTSITYEQFRWNEPLQEELFALNVPNGYRLEELTLAVVRPGRIYYHKGWTELYSIEPDGQKPETQFVPRLVDSPTTYVSDRAELSPDGRLLAIGYTHSTKEGHFPPYRVLLWDRTQPKEPAVEVYARPDGELQSWQFSQDGRRLYVTWWQGIEGRKGPDGRTGADIVDLETKATQAVKLPTYKDAEGKESEMRFAAPTPDGKQNLAVGNGLYLTNVEGNIVRRLSSADAIVMDRSVRISPEAKHVVYATYQKDRSQALFVVSLVDGQTKELLGAGKATNLRASWSPDGKRIAYTCRSFDPDNPPFNRGSEAFLKLVDLDGSNGVTRLTEKGHPNGPGLELTGWR